MKKTMKLLIPILIVLLILYIIFGAISCKKIKKACDLVFESKGIYNNTYSELIDEESFEDLSAEIIYYKHKEVERGADFEVLNYNVKTSLSPLDFIFYGEINLRCQYSIKYKEKIIKTIFNLFK